MIYGEKSSFFRGNKYTCGKQHKYYCKICEFPVINECSNDETHDIIDIKEVNKAKRRICRHFSSMLKSDVLFNRKILFLKIKTDYEASQQIHSIFNSDLIS